MNYVVFSLVTNNYDGFSGNWQWYTLDGQQWAVAPFNCELTFGFNDDTTDLWPADRSSKKYDYHMDNALTNGPMFWMKKYFWNEVRTRYTNLRDAEIISTKSITDIAQDWFDRIGPKNYEEEQNKWGSGSQSAAGVLGHIQTWTRNRIALYDNDFSYTPLGDLNADGRITVTDLALLVKALLNGVGAYDPRLDINHDGEVDAADVTALSRKVLYSE